MTFLVRGRCTSSQLRWGALAQAPSRYPEIESATDRQWARPAAVEHLRDVAGLISNVLKHANGLIR
jgi:hypothetical protein